MSEKTIFEKIAAREVPVSVIAEDENNIAFLDIAPFEKGHIIVTPKIAKETVWDMTESEYLSLQSMVHKISKHVYSKMNVGVSIYQRNLFSAGQEVPHVHVHIVPRTDGEEKRPIFNDLMETRITYKDEEEKETFLELLKIS